MKKSMLCFIILLINSTVYSQNLQFFNVDASAFPNVKANFYAFDALKYSDNKNAEIYEHIGDIYKANGDIETAVYYWNESIKLNPPNTVDINKKITNAKK